MLHHVKRHKSKSSLDKVIYVFAFATPLFEIPQAVNIYAHRSVGNVSLITWGFFFISSLVWLIYGTVHRIRPIIIAYTLYAAVEITIVAGLLMYS